MRKTEVIAWVAALTFALLSLYFRSNRCEPVKVSETVVKIVSDSTKERMLRDDADRWKVKADESESLYQSERAARIRIIRSYNEVEPTVISEGVGYADSVVRANW